MSKLQLNLLALLSAQLVLFPQTLKSQDGSQPASQSALELGSHARSPSDPFSLAATSSRRSAEVMTGSAVHLTLSDLDLDEEAHADVPASEHAGHAAEDSAHVYPDYVCHDPGFPQKPYCDRPGDINRSAFPPIRYCQDDCFRAGWPHAVRKWATCSINPHYSASYVGGGSAWIFPHGRGRSCEEGTWGLDYSLWSRPKLVWMKWTNGREQGGLGAYETDH